MAKEMIRDASSVATKEVANMKSKADMNVIREDIETLKEDARVVMDDAVTLGRDLKTEGRKQLTAAEKRAKESLEEAKVNGRARLDDVVAYVQQNPGQSLAAAFLGGIIASYLFRRN